MTLKFMLVSMKNRKEDSGFYATGLQRALFNKFLYKLRQ